MGKSWGEIDAEKKAWEDEQAQAQLDQEAKDLSTPVAIAEDQFKYYEDTFIPIERGLGGQVRGAGEIESLSKNAGIQASGLYQEEIPTTPTTSTRRSIVKLLQGQTLFPVEPVKMGGAVG